MAGPRRAGSRGSVATLAVVAIAIAAVLLGACAAYLTTPHGGPAAIANVGSTPAGSRATASAAPGSPASPTAGAPSSAPSFEPVPANLPPIPAGAVPILYYHRVQAPPPDYPTWSRARQAAFIDYDALPTAFAAQLDWLLAQGYTTILPRDLAAYWDHGAPLPAKPVILTFDDGWQDWVSTVLPMLQARGMVAEFYLTLTAIADGNITWPEVQALADAGEGIGAHDVHHVQLAELGHGRPDASTATMWAEVNGARQTIGAHIGTMPDSMAYVGGGFSPALVALVARAGYTTARSIQRGIIQAVGLRYELHVVRIGPYDDVMNVMTGAIDPNLPVFVARMHGVSDRLPSS